ncbi:hypothetical protein KAH27_04070 [bacterium]|nr:hypothetical protein [bacterium]
MRYFFLILLLSLTILQSLYAVDHFVATNGSHTSPFTSWATAATNIQDAVDASSSGDLVRVSNGVYYISVDISVPQNISVKSENGYEVTTVKSDGSDRCFYIRSGVMLEGFTLTGGSRNRGGAVYCRNGGTISNCFIVKNNAGDRGAGVYCRQGGTVISSFFYDNTVSGYGGGIYCEEAGFITNCFFYDNSASGAAGTGGGGVYCYRGGTVTDCSFYDNYSGNDGGGVIAEGGGALIDNCIFKHNGAGDWGGAITIYFNNSTIRNCLMVDNIASEGGGIYCYNAGTIQNCTIVGNSVTEDGGGVKFNNSGPSIINSIIYYNESADTNYNNYTGINGTYNCTTPLLSGTGNITNDPAFLQLSERDLHITTNSPCVNTGNNQGWMSNAVDLDDNARIIDTTVDIGCYELGKLTCFFVGDKLAGPVPLSVDFSSYVTGTNTDWLYYYWDFDNDGTFDIQGVNSNSPSYNYTNANIYSVLLLVSNNVGETAIYLRNNYITVANPRYVSLDGNHVSPFTSWADAATNIQAAVNVSSDDMKIIVSNGTHFVAEQVNVSNAIEIISYAGREKTIVASRGNSRCFYIVDGSTLAGFTFSNGYAHGSGEDEHGGAVYCYSGGLITNCIVVYNEAETYGGGIYCHNGGIVISSLIYTNISEYGGGIYCDDSGPVWMSVVSNNYASRRGGGIYCYGHGRIYSSLITHNTSGNRGGGLAMFHSGGVVSACTITKNYSGNRGGGFYSRDGGIIKNSIILYNTASTAANSNWFSEITGTDYGRSITYCNTAPITGMPPGSGNNINSNPQFTSIANDNFRLQPISPCIDSGNNSAWMTGESDLDGNPRIINLIVNRGAYESSLTPIIIVDVPINDFVFPFSTIHYDFIGRTISADGNIWLSNNWPGGISYDFFASQANWTNNIEMPKYGNYEITFYGTNSLGSITNTTIRVTRKRGQIFRFR